MIYCLTGKLLEKAPDYAVVSCGGVGYLAAIPSTTAGALPAVGEGDAQVGRGRRLADAPLPRRDGDNSGPHTRLL